MPSSASSSRRSARATTEGAEVDGRRTIVFLHGTRLTGAAWAGQIASLDTEFRCIAPDLPGHGTSSAEPFTLAGAASAVADIIERESPDRPVVLVGLSLGGYVATVVAATRPELVAGLAISGATAEPSGIRTLGYVALATVFERVPESILLRVNRWYFRRRYPATVSRPILAGGFWFRGGAIALRALAGESFRPQLAAYPGPSLLINGELDLFFRTGERAFLEAAVDPRRVLIRRATHLANLDQPVAFAAAIRRFARSIP